MRLPLLSSLFYCFFALQVQGQLYFPPNTGTTWDTIAPSSLGWCQANIDSLYDFLDSSNSKAFIVLKDGKIVLERYFDGHTATTNWYWASAGKSLMAFVVGLAQEDNYLNITDTTSTYLGQGWTSCTPAQEARISIWNQLTMTTGLDDVNVVDPDCMLDTCLQYLADPGTRWAYHNAPYRLLYSVLQNATGQNPNNYITQRLRTPTGMDGFFFQQNNSLLFLSTARSMARFGLLTLAEGAWNGTPVLADSTYFQAMVNTSQSLNEAYGYLWWLNGKNSYMLPQLQFTFSGSAVPNAPADMVAAIGKNGQLINVVPSQNLVVIRMGNSPDNSLVPTTLNNDIWQYLNDLNCQPLATKTTAPPTIAKLYPNPTTARYQVQLQSGLALNEVNIRVYDLQGRLLLEEQPGTNVWEGDLGDYPQGVYVVQVQTGEGIWQEKLVKW